MYCGGIGCGLFGWMGVGWVVGWEVAWQVAWRWHGASPTIVPTPSPSIPNYKCPSAPPPPPRPVPSPFQEAALVHREGRIKHGLPGTNTSTVPALMGKVAQPPHLLPPLPATPPLPAALDRRGSSRGSSRGSRRHSSRGSSRGSRRHSSRGSSRGSRRHSSVEAAAGAAAEAAAGAVLGEAL